MSALLVEVQPGHAGPPGSTVVHHNGKQYAIFEGVAAGNTYIPTTFTSYPSYVGPAVDLQPAMNAIAQLHSMVNTIIGQVAALQNQVTEIQAASKALEEWGLALPEELESWQKKLAEAVETRFDEIDQALRLLVDP